MKKLYYLILLFVVSFSACTQVEENKPVVLNGQISNPTAEKITVKVGDRDFESPIKEDGSFHLKIDSLGDSQIAYFAVDKQSSKMYLRAGDSLYFTLDATPEQFDETIVYQGIGAENNQFFVKNFLVEEQNKIDYRSLLQLEEAAFVTQLDSIFDVFESTLTEHQGFSEDLQSYLAEDLKYKKANGLGIYANYRKNFAKDYVASEKLSEQIGDLPFENEKAFKINQGGNYIAYASDKLIKLVSDSISAYKATLDSVAKKEFNETIPVRFAVIKNTFESSLIKSHFAQRAMLSYLNRGFEGEDISELKKTYQEIVTKEADRKKVDELYAGLMKLTKGNPAPDFSGTDAEGSLVSLSDFKGKYVYVDVWATWCGPCVYEIPFLKKLEAEYHGKNIVFMSISVDAPGDREKWIKMVAEKELQGVQIMADKAWESDVTQKYKINGIPRFMLFDTKGNIVDVKAPRPSGNIREVFDGLEKMEETVALRE